ncbi:MAG: hypothetical protein AB7T38_05825 [Nitrospirales bacterium]
MFDELLHTAYDNFEFIGFACLGIASLFLVSRLSGWRTISQHYPSRPHKIIEKWYLRSMWMGFLFTYENCVTMKATNEGLHLSLIILFRIGHHPLLIPWEDIHIEKYKGWFTTYAKLTLRQVPNISIYLRKDLALEINGQRGGDWETILQ